MCLLAISARSSDPRHHTLKMHASGDHIADVEVAQDAALVISGADPQLEAAVAVVLEELEQNPPPPPNAQQPPPPVRSKL